MRWNKENIKKLKELWPQKTSSEIAKVIGNGITRNAVIGKASRLGLSKDINSLKKRQKRKSITNSEISREIESSFLFERVSFDSQCQWPISDDSGKKFKFCNQKTKEGKPYCSKHCQKAYRG